LCENINDCLTVFRLIYRSAAHFHAYRLSIPPQLYSLIARQYIDINMRNHGGKHINLVLQSGIVPHYWKGKIITFG